MKPLKKLMLFHNYYIVHTSTVRSKLSFIWLLLSPLHSLGKSPGNNQAMGSEKGNDSLLSFSVPFFFLLTSFFSQKEFCQSGHFHAGILRVCTTVQPRFVEQKKCQTPKKGEKAARRASGDSRKLSSRPLKISTVQFRKPYITCFRGINQK